MEDKQRGRKKPGLALILSAIFPGLGQIYNNQVPKGAVLMGLNLVINFLLIKPFESSITTGKSISIPHNSTLFIIVAYMAAGLVLWVYAMIDAKRTAEKINESEIA